MVNALLNSWTVVQTITLPALLQHRARCLLTLIGVLIGVEVAVAIAILNRSLSAAFEHTVTVLAGGADLQITNPAGLPESLVEALRSLNGVDVVDSLVIGTVRTAYTDLTIFGVDLFADQRIRETQIPRPYVHIDDVLRFANNSDSIALSRTLANRWNVHRGDSFDVIAPSGSATLTIRGSIEPVGPGALFGGAIAVVDLPVAQRLMNREGRVDQINLRATPGVPVAALRARVAQAIGMAGTVGSPKDAGTTLASLLGSLQMLLTLASLNGIVVGFFIIHHTMKTSIATRRRALAIARALGFARRSILTALLLEALAFGTAGAILGSLAALLAAAVSSHLFTDTVASLYARIDYPTISLTWHDLALALVLGISSALAASLGSAIDILHLPVTDQLRSAVPLPQRSARMTFIPSMPAGASLMALGILLSRLSIRTDAPSASLAVILSSTLLLAAGVALLVPYVVWIVARLSRRLAYHIDAMPAELAFGNLEREPYRSRGTICAIMVAFSLVLLIATYIASLKHSIIHWLDQVFAADLFVSATTEPPSATGPTLRGDIQHVIRTTPGVADVSMTRWLTVQVRHQMAVLHTDSATAVARMNYPLVAAASSTYLEDFAAGRGVFVSDNLAYKTGLRVGDIIDLNTYAGRRQFPILAVVIDYSRDSGALIVESSTYKTLWNDDQANYFLVWLRQGAQVDDVRKAIIERLAGRATPTVMTSAAFKQTVAEALDRAMLLSYAIQFVAILVAVIGVVNFFLTEAVDRSREMGLLRSVALTRAELIRMFAIEALTIGTIGGMAAICYGIPLSYLMVTRWQRLVAGWTLLFTFPVGLALAGIAIAAFTAACASYFPTLRSAMKPPADLVGVE